MAVLIKWEGEAAGVIMREHDIDRAEHAFRRQYPHLPAVHAEPFSGAVETRWKVKPRPQPKAK